MLESLTEANYQRDRKAVFVHTDRMFAYVMAFQYILAVILAIEISPRTWSGAASSVHPHVWTAVVLGGALAGYPIFLAVKYPGETSTRHAIAIAQALFSALLIHLTNGRIETHFHIFGSLAFLAFYRDWRVLVSATVVVVADHLVRGAWFPGSIYGINIGEEWRFVEHSAWVLFEDAFLIFACIRSAREMKVTAGRQADLEQANLTIERSATETSQQSSILNAMLEAMSDGVIAVGAMGEVLLINPAAHRILGPGSNHPLFQEWPELFDLYVDELPLAPEETPLARASRGEFVDLEDVRLHRRKSGDGLWMDIAARPLVDESSVRLGGMTVFRDVTLRKELLQSMALARDEAERANRAKGEFLSRMSHELRTPMNAILGFSQILQMDELNEEQSDSVEHILVAGRHLLRLIDDILDIAGNAVAATA